MRQTLGLTVMLVLIGDRIEAHGEGTRPWRNEARFQRIAAALADTRVIDNHTHLIRRQPLLANLDKEVPMLVRSDTPLHVSVLKSRFGIEWDPIRPDASDKLGRQRREELVARAGGETAYWHEHLDLATVDLALENQERAITPKNDRLKWVPNSTTLLFPLDSRALEARNPGVEADVRIARDAISRLSPDSPLPRCTASPGRALFLRLMESDVRNLKEILTDPRFFGTQFVLIHGGAPLIEQAAYLAGNKANVWVDTSALPFLYPTPDLAAAFRKYITFAPDRTLFGTDAGGSPTIPVGAEVQHLGLVPAAREALTLALSDLVRDGMFDEAVAIRIGKDVLRENARRLYGF